MKQHVNQEKQKYMSIRQRQVVRIKEIVLYGLLIIEQSILAVMIQIRAAIQIIVEEVKHLAPLQQQQQSQHTQ